jgi:hypothetical protein
MGIAVYGIIATTSNKGSELGKLISLVQELRYAVCTNLLIRVVLIFSQKGLPALDQRGRSSFPSPQNITRECGWHPIWEKELANVLHFYRSGQFDAGYLPNELDSTLEYPTTVLRGKGGDPALEAESEVPITEVARAKIHPCPSGTPYMIVTNL